jgi:cytochrome b561
MNIFYLALIRCLLKLRNFYSVTFMTKAESSSAAQEIAHILLNRKFITMIIRYLPISRS